MLKKYSVAVANSCGKQKKLTVLARTGQEARKMVLDLFGRGNVVISKILAE